MRIKAQNGTVTWFQVNNLVPIIFGLITTAITVAGFYFKLSEKLSLTCQKVDTLVANQEKIIQKYEGVQVRQGQLELKNVSLEEKEKSLEEKFSLYLKNNK